MQTDSVSLSIIGSVNLDLVARVNVFPRPGETITGASIRHFPGGKGANQALAARRQGADVYLCACVGGDPSAEEALTNLRDEGVDLTYCQTLEEVPTGQALILVADSGENQIVVAPGANAAFQPRHLKLPRTDALIAQLEIPTNTLIKAAQQHEGFFCLNAAPAKPVPPELLDLVDLLVVNELEAQAIGPALEDFQGLLVTTYGAKGAVMRQRGNIIAESASPNVNAIDTVGAGDTFTAVLCHAICSGMTNEPALQRACVAGALATTREGAQSSPTSKAIDQAMPC